MPDGTTSGSEQTGKLRLLISDAPFPLNAIEEAGVTITRIEVRRAEQESAEDEETLTTDANENGESESTELDEDPSDDASGDSGASEDGLSDGQGESLDDSDEAGAEDGDSEEGADADDEADDTENALSEAEDDETDDSPFIVIFEGEQDFNLLDLRNGRTDLLADVEIPAGTYTLMRLFVSGGWVTLKDDNEDPTDNPVINLTVPSGAQSGIKLHFTFGVLADEETLLLLDVDLTRAFTAIPGGHADDPSAIRDFHFHPSFAMRLVNLLEAGSIAGTVTSTADDTGIEGATVTAYDGNDEQAGTTFTETDGTYMLGGLLPGDYRLTFEAEDFEAGELDPVSVAAGVTTEDADMALTPLPE